MADFYFGRIRDEKELKSLRAFLLSQNMNYPLYEDWVSRCIYEIDAGYKKAILAFARKGKEQWLLVGDAIYQQAKESQLPKTMHFKNMRVLDQFQLEGVASFLVKQVEKEARSENLKTIICDFRADKKDILKFLLIHNYRTILNQPLYDSNNSDIVMIKNL